MKLCIVLSYESVLGGAMKFTSTKVMGIHKNSQKCFPHP